MGELIRIGAEEAAPGLSAVIDTTGAWMTELALDEVPILFPRQTLLAEDGTKKVRGGMHICSPYFGAPKVLTRLGEPQHGYARQAEWTVEDQDTNTVRLAHLRNDGGYYDGLLTQLEIEIGGELGGEAIDHLSLLLRYTSLSDKSMGVYPGFHPYFDSLVGFDDLETNVPEVCLEGLSTSPTNKQEFHLVNGAGVNIAMVSKALGEAVKWTDRLEDNDYTCIEPVFSALGLHGGDDAANSIGLKCRDTVSFDLTMLFESA